MRGSFLSLLLICCTFTGIAQNNDSAMVVDLASIRFQEFISKKCWFAATPKSTVADQDIPSLPFKEKASKYAQGFPASLVEKDIYLKFALANNSDTTEVVCLSPGFYCKNITLFRALPDDPAGNLVKQPDSSTMNRFYKGVGMIRLQPHEQAVFYCRFNYVRTNVNTFFPRLIENDYLQQWLMTIQNRERALDIFTYIVSGILLLMLFYSLAAYLQNRSKEFIYYAIYTLCTVLLLFLKSYLNTSDSTFNYFNEEYLDFMILSGGVFSYLLFVRNFLNTQQLHPRLDKFLKAANWILLALCGIFSFIYFFTEKYVILSIMENLVIKVFFFIIGIIFIAYSFGKKDALLNYLAAGNFALIVFSVLSQGIIMFKWKFVTVAPGSPSPIFNRAMFYYEIGLVLELGFFLAGLAYKNRRDIIGRVKERERLKLENERKEFEKQMAVVTAKQEERDRISSDMHDELGSGMTAIRLMSEIMKSKIKDQKFPELEKISSSANDLLGKMDTLIWTMKSSNDTLESLIAYIRSHAIEYFDGTPIDCKVIVPAVIPQTDLTGEKRRNIFLSVKEALNNALKHSQASEILIDISARDNCLRIVVADNGIGIDPEKLRRFGNGLSNMRRRMESIEGSFKVENNGCSTLTFETPL